MIISKIYFHWLLTLYAFWRHCLKLFVSFISIICQNSTARSSRMLILFFILTFILSKSYNSALNTRWIFLDWCQTSKSNWLKYYNIWISYRFNLFIKIVIIKWICHAIKIMIEWSVKIITVSFNKINLIRCFIFHIIHTKSAVFIFMNQ